MRPMSLLSAFRPCGRDPVEFFNSTGWAFYGQVAVHGSRNTQKDLHWPTYRDLAQLGSAP